MKMIDQTLYLWTTRGRCRVIALTEDGSAIGITQFGGALVRGAPIDAISVEIQRETAE